MTQDTSGPGSGAVGRDRQLSAARELLRDARGVVILTGAGVSAESGLRTFRDPDGHWKRHRPEDLATPEAFERDPCLVWSWYDARRRAAAAVDPNPAHLAIAEFAAGRDDVILITQNVDSLHTRAAQIVAKSRRERTRDEANVSPRKEQAGNGNQKILELHGNIFRTRCTRCADRRERHDPIDASSRGTLPRCTACGGLLRPDVVWFGEPLGEAIERAFVCAAQVGVCLVVGTSAMVQPAASVALMTVRAGGEVVEVNPARTPLTEATAVSLRETAVGVVPELLR